MGRRPSVPLVTASLVLFASAATAATVTYHDVTDAVGISYNRVPSATLATAQAIQAKGQVVMADFVGIQPIKPHGAPGVAIFDHDGDGDLDLYVTNGPGAPNSLFSNQLAETGELAFVDLAVAAGVAATDQDSSGVCYGDVDNDGDPDLYVMGRSEPNRLFENLGNGTFADVTALSGTAGGSLSATTCSFGDVNGDGLLDLLVGNSFDMATSIPIFIEPFALNERNQLFVNTGGNVFVDDSVGSGIAAAQDITWAVALVDVDQDGDTDAVTANDNAGMPFARDGGVDRGFIRILKNDGDGNFTDVSAELGMTTRPGDWMGLSFADFNHDGTLDLFGTNSGDWMEILFGLPMVLGDQPSRWMLQEADGTFSDPGVGALIASPFGWGTAAFDADHDGDSDIVFIGGLDTGPLVDLSNPGTLLLNDGDAGFSYDPATFAFGAEHTRRIEHGLAIGDLDGDGFADIVTVSAADVPSQPIGPILYPFSHGSPFDGVAAFFPTFFPGANPGEFVFSGAQFDQGTVAVELSSGNGNGWVEVETLGTVGLTASGVVNRDGIGAVVRVIPHGGRTAILPVLGGSSYASQHAPAQQLGLGSAHKATVEVLWPGGVVNRLYDVRAGERVLFPEIPCSFGGGSTRAYLACVDDSLDALVGQGVLSPGDAARFRGSAARAFQEERRGH